MIGVFILEGESQLRRWFQPIGFEVGVGVVPHELAHAEVLQLVEEAINGLIVGAGLDGEDHGPWFAGVITMELKLSAGAGNVQFNKGKALQVDEGRVPPTAGIGGDIYGEGGADDVNTLDADHARIDAVARRGDVAQFELALVVALLD